MGRVFKPKYAWTKTDGTRVEKITTAWYIEYTDASGKTVRRKAGHSKEQAADALRKAESDVLAARNGLPTQRAGELLARALMGEYLTVQRGRVSHGHLVYLAHRLKEILKVTRTIYVKDLTPDVMERFLQQLYRAKFSARTQNVYLQAAKGMLRWAVLSRKIPYNPLDAVRARPEREKRHARRALNAEEIDRLLEAATNGPLRRRARSYAGKENSVAKVDDREFSGLQHQGRNNAMIYRLMLEAGMRRNEVKHLRWCDLDLSAGWIQFRGTWTKNGKEELLPLAPSLLGALREWRLQCGNPLSGTVVCVSSRILRQLDDDLTAARIAKRDEANRVVDLHALRHTFGTRLGQTPGIDPKSVQTLMRHSDARLTFSVYVHSDKDRLRSALEKMQPTNVPQNRRAQVS